MKLFKEYLALLKNSVFFNSIWLSEHRLRSNIKQQVSEADISSLDRWLDIGCGLRPYESYFPTGSYVGVDIEESGRNSSLKAPDYFYNGKILPFLDDSFEGLICTQVLEHVADPSSLLSEMNRVLKPGGVLIISVPFAWQEHEVPYDFLRFSRYGISEILSQTGFNVEYVLQDSKSIETLSILLNVYIINNLVLPIRGFGYLTSLLVCFPIQIFSVILQKVLPDKGALYLNLVVQAKKTNI